MTKLISALMLSVLSVPALAQGVAKPAPSPAMSMPVPGQQLKIDPGVASEPQVSMDDLKKMPIVRNLISGGGEIYYLGARSGLMGFLIYKSEQVQTFYLTPDLQSVVFGAMFSADAANITSQQVGEASNQNTQLSAIFKAAAEKQQEFSKTAGLSNEEAGLKDNSGLPKAASLSPGERLHHDFIVAPGVVVGEPEKPLLMMVVDPLCVHCQATWRMLKSSVMGGVLRVKLIPIGAEGSEQERMAAKFLRIPEPLKVWNKVEEGDVTPLDGAPTPADLDQVRMSMKMVQNWKITATPYLVYRGKDGKVKVVQGEPEKIGNVLADLLP